MDRKTSVDFQRSSLMSRVIRNKEHILVYEPNFRNSRGTYPETKPHMWYIHENNDTRTRGPKTKRIEAYCAGRKDFTLLCSVTKNCPRYKSLFRFTGNIATVGRIAKSVFTLSRIVFYVVKLWIETDDSEEYGVSIFKAKIRI